MPSISPERMAEILARMKSRGQDDGQTFDEHVLKRSLELGREVMTRRRVYLDTKYWVWLRDAALNRSREHRHYELLDLLQRAASANRIICPFSDVALFELLRQTDDMTRLATARLVDTLGRGVIILNSEDRTRVEIVDFLLKIPQADWQPVAPVERVWSKCGHVLGVATPVFPDVTAREQARINKTFFDFLWDITFEEFLTDSVPPELDKADTHEWADRLNTRLTHEAKTRSWKKLRAVELKGFFENHSDQVYRAVCELLAIVSPATDLPKSEAETETWVNVLTNLVRLGKAGSALPTAQVVAELHAMARWDSQRGFKAGDLHDFYHATAALPYCDFFLTERFLATALQRPPLSLSKVFPTRVVSSLSEAIEIARTL